MEKFAVLTIPKKSDFSLEKAEFQIIDEVSDYLEENNARIIDFEVLPTAMTVNVHRILCRMDFSEPTRMMGVDDVIR